MKSIISVLLIFAALSFAAEITKKSTLVFFINPNGRPCQIQDEILTKSKVEIEKSATIRYVKTTIPNDRETFYEYGVRSLPQLILVDEKGAPIHRFAPGIQEIETIMQTLLKK